jgi:NADH-quinone oxidoreductase subunit M
MLETWGLTAAVFLPVVGAAIIALTPKGSERAIKFFSVVFSGLPLLLGILLIGPYRQGGNGLRLQVNTPWIPSINARYHIGIDGISLPLLELTFLITFLCMIYSLWHVPEPHNPKGFLALCLLLETGMAGTFIALDLVLFFIFWELVLVPMYFLIGLWGGPRREYAAIKFFLYTLFGSVFMLLGFLALYFRSTPHTFDILQLQGIGSGFPVGVQTLIFAGLGLGFAIKVPMWPFHTWLPDAHTEAPTVGSVLLAAVLLKMGTYGFIRISMPILPDAARNFAPLIGALAVIAIIYGSLCCLAQTDLKRMIAFSSVGHMGFVMLGIATMTDIGLNAAIYGMVAHGVVTGMLFFLAGSIHERYHTREISELGGGLLIKMPVLGSLLTYAAIASLGLPGLAGFWGEVMALLASYNPAPGLNVGLFRGYMVIGGIGTILTAGYSTCSRWSSCRGPPSWCSSSAWACSRG